MLTELSALLDLLKAKGVAKYDGWCPLDGGQRDRVVVTFAPTAPPPDTSREEPSKPQDECKCGHALAEHQDGLCMHACEEEKCR